MTNYTYTSNTPERNLFLKGKKYLENKKHDKALAIFKKIWKDTPYKEVALNLGASYQGLGDFDNAIDYYLKANDPNLPFTDNSFIKTGYPEALCNLGRIAYAIEDDASAIRYYNHALKLDPNYEIVWWNLCNATFRQYCSRKYNNLDLCWQLWEFRFRQHGGVGLRNDDPNIIPWNMKDHCGKLIVMAEQGFGDQIMFGRYLKYAEQFCDELVVQMNPRIAGLFPYQNFESVKAAKATHAVPICSLGVLVDHIPSGEWLSTEKVKGSGLRIGVTWSGSKTHGNNHLRSSNPQIFKKLSKYGELFTLNPTEWGTRGFTDMRSNDWVGSLRDIGTLDLVVSVDTSIVHLCGSAGVPCLVIMPGHDADFRWGDSTMGPDNIWYSSVKVIRNHHGWEDCIAKAGEVIENRCY